MAWYYFIYPMNYNTKWERENKVILDDLTTFVTHVEHILDTQTTEMGLSGQCPKYESTERRSEKRSEKKGLAHNLLSLFLLSKVDE